MMILFMDTALLILLLVALIPPAYIMYYIYRQDKVEHEPWGLVARIFIYGALSILPVLIAEILLDNVFSTVLPTSSAVYILLENFIGVAMVEELGKYVATKRIWKKPAFNYRFDAVVYGVAAALGFAALENVMYVLQNGLATGIVRALTAVPSHAIDGVFMGLYIGEAKYCECLGDTSGKKSSLRKALLIPILLHGIYDALLSFESAISILIFYVFVIILDVVALRRIKNASRNDVPFYHMSGTDNM